MKKSLLLSLAVAGQLLPIPAIAQGPGREVTVLRMSGPQLGVRLVEVDQDAVTRLKLKEEKGALVTEVVKDSPAELAGIKEDDVIVRFQGASILTAAQLGRLVREVPAGRKVDIDLIRAGAPVTVTATIKQAEWSSRGMEGPQMAELRKRLNEKTDELRWKAEDLERLHENVRPETFAFKFDGEGPAWVGLDRVGRGRLGVTYSEIDGQLAKYFKAPEETAVLVESVVADSPAEAAGIKAGDLLLKVGDAKVGDGRDLLDAVRALKDGTASPVTVWRDGKSVDLTVTVEKKERATPRRPRPVT